MVRRVCFLLVVLSLSCSRERPPQNTEGPLGEAHSPSNDPPKTQSDSSSRGSKSSVIAPKNTAPSPSLGDLPPYDGKLPAWGKNVKAQGTFGVVSSVEDSATRAGVKILEEGGNAIDAAVATALALAVTHPSAGNLGGGGFLLLKMGNRVEAIDFRENSPASLSDSLFWEMIREGGRGARSVGTPGTVAGLYLAHSRHGRLSWEAVVSPAYELARDGYTLGERQARTIAWADADLRRDVISKARFFPKGRRVRAGDLIVSPKLALALNRIRNSGPAGFYEGPTARDIIASLGENALLSLDDLKQYRALLRPPLYFNFGGYRIITMPSPSAGGVALSQNLLMLQALSVEQSAANSAARLHLIAEASRRSQVERQLFVVSPDEQSQEARRKSRSRALDPLTWLKDHPIDPEKATLSSSLHPGYSAILKERKHTTHLSVIDASGGLVSCTVTLSGSFGSRLFSKETGIALNNSVASFSSIGVNTPSPARRTTSSMAPTLALLGKNNALVLGSPGGDTIPSTVTQVFLSLALDGDTLTEAVEKPRIHQGFAPQGLSTERRRPLSPALIQKLHRLGHSIGRSPAAIGDANIAARMGNMAYAIADPREGGLALAASRANPRKGKLD